MKTALLFLKKYLLEMCIFLSFILPPIGVFLLLVIGSYHLHQAWKNGAGLSLTPGLFLLGCMFVSSIGSSMVMDDQSYFLVPALILSYMGIYMKITRNGVQKTFLAFKWITIYGGVYFYSLYPFQELLISPTFQNYISGTALIGTGSIQGYKRLIGAAYNPNFSVALLLLGLSFLLSECLKNLRKADYLKTSIQAVITCILAHAIILTGSRAGFSAMLVIFLLFLFRWNKPVTFILILAMGMNMRLILDWMPRNEHLLQSAETRKEIWKNSFSLWQEHSLFGMTPMGFKEEYFHYFNEQIPHAHNLLLGMFTEYGALGGIACLIVLLINMYKVIYLYFTKQNNKYLDSFLLSLPVMLLTGVFDYVLFSPQVALMTIILMAYWDKYTARLSFRSTWILSIPKWSYRFFF
ncbi:O-antigen ligase family protein [Pseudalkalibacillus sp. A8]|uniref:O-antigen ligase family protein n=1 Tax=Pseudalkalibacillus sp. A8 TaxID=3382641 RepID=UPI0038B50E2C